MIQVKNLTKRYGPYTAVSNINFSVKKGEIVGFLGPNGAGKTTTMKILTALMPASEGEATVAGFNVFEKPIEVKKIVGFLPETPPVYTEMQVKDYVIYSARLHNLSKKDAITRTDAVLEKTGLGSVKNRLIAHLSKGYRQRVGLAQALVHNPAVLILDEPTVGLDPNQIIEIRHLIKSLAGDHTIILSSHILPEITATCDRVIVINKGKIVAQDRISKLTEQTGFNLTVKNISERGVNAIQKINGVQSLNAADSIISIKVDPNGADIRDQIVATAVENNMGVLEFIGHKQTLEEVFLKLTTSDKGDLL